jgi:ribulose-phosphate 3-epimerase
MEATIGKVTQSAKIAAGLFWADYSVLGAQVQELEAAGVDWFHVEVRDGRYMDFGMPRGGFDILEGLRKSTTLEIEAQLQMVRPGFDVFRQLADLGVNLISLPVETMGEMILQAVTFIKDELGLKAGVWAWQGTPIQAFEQLVVPYIDIIEYETRAHFWVKEAGKSPHDTDPIMHDNIRRMHEMIAAAGLEQQMELMVDGGLNIGNVADYIRFGMTVGEFSSPLLKGAGGKFVPGTGQIEAAVKKLRAVMDEASQVFRDDSGLMTHDPDGRVPVDLAEMG